MQLLRMNITGCDCHWCKQRSCYLCWCLDKRLPNSFPPGRSISRCQDCGEEYCDACFHRDEHDLCRYAPDGSPLKRPVPGVSLRILLYNLGREDDPMCQAAEYYLKEVVGLMAEIKTAREADDQQQVDSCLDRLLLLNQEAK